jgi:hypothetical protein
MVSSGGSERRYELTKWLSVGGGDLAGAVGWVFDGGAGERPFCDECNGVSLATARAPTDVIWGETS